MHYCQALIWSRLRINPTLPFVCLKSNSFFVFSFLNKDCWQGEWIKRWCETFLLILSRIYFLFSSVKILWNEGVFMLIESSMTMKRWDKIIIIIMSCRQHGYPWPSLATSYHSSPLAGLLGYIPYPHTAAVCMFELVVLLLLGHMRGSIGVHYWWVRPCFSSSVLRVWFV